MSSAVEAAPQLAPAASPAQSAIPNRVGTATTILLVVVAVPIAIITIPGCLVWALVISVKSFYLLVSNRRGETAHMRECFWKNSLTLILLPFRVFMFLSPALRNVNLPNYVDLVNVDITQQQNLPTEFNPLRCEVIDAAAELYEHMWAYVEGKHPEKWPVMDGALCYEMKRFFTREEAAQAGIIDPHPEDPRPIQPLFVGFRGTYYLWESINCAWNLLGGMPKNFAKYVGFTHEVQAEIAQKNAASTEFRYVPVVVGHSMGGAFASAIAIKQGISSITFNSMGWGSELYKTVGDDACYAADTVDAPYHLNLSVEGCWVSDPDALLFQRLPVRTVHLPNCTMMTNSTEIHQRMAETWRAFCAKAGLPHGADD
jgi:hypothetical protein